MAKSKLAILGGGGHARVLLDGIYRSGAHVSAIIDPGISIDHTIFGVPVVGGEDWLTEVSAAEYLIINGIGAQPRLTLRQSVYDRVKQLNFNFLTVVHPSADVGLNVELFEGSQIMAGAIVQCSTRIGINSIINTGAKVDHDCEIDNHVFIGPGATLCGNVRIGSGAYIGAGAIVLPGIVIGAGAIVGAGAVVTRDVDEGAEMIGIPAYRRD
jgi:UDP-perosamine 4-acetyltransferase